MYDFEVTAQNSGLKKIMKELQVWLKVELREVRRDKRRQGDAENVQACSSIKRCKRMVMDLDQTAWLKVELREVRRDKRRQGDAEDEQTCSSIKRCRHKDRESNDLVNHIRGVFRYFIVDVVDPGSDVARCGRELGKQFLSHEQG
ncbi:hypothetical protein F2Q69_00053846 [Brassica cretica]|uniref:Uncharacterized protein n=1 Tax=Brassica cretica TaxID=69181 RepID=A0A8S9N4C3_BRACR|nr:hypothetical protein F2Q69_00053846 [Brassica cretica]